MGPRKICHEPNRFGHRLTVVTTPTRAERFTAAVLRLPSGGSLRWWAGGKGTVFACVHGCETTVPTDTIWHATPVNTYEACPV